MNIIIDGSREEGKTTLAMSIAQSRHAGVVVFDQRGMIEGIVCWGEDELQDAIDRGRWQHGPLVYRYDGVNTAEEFAAFCRVLFPPRFTLGGFACVIDEAGRLQSASYCNEDLDRVVRQHPTKPAEHKVTVIQTMHTLSESCAELRSLIDEYYIARLTSVNDLKAIETLTGIPEIREVVKNLPQHHFIKYLNSRQPEGSPAYYILDDPAAWHIRATNQDDSFVDSGESRDTIGEESEFVI